MIRKELESRHWCWKRRWNIGARLFISLVCHRNIGKVTKVMPEGINLKKNKTKNGSTLLNRNFSLLSYHKMKFLKEKKKTAHKPKEAICVQCRRRYIKTAHISLKYLCFHFVFVFGLVFFFFFWIDGWIDRGWMDEKYTHTWYKRWTIS